MSEIPLLHTCLPVFLIRKFHNKKSHAQKIAWLKSPVRRRTLAPFGGITRIRFKGSSKLDLSAIAAPPQSELRVKS
jgi:hypothetical protein